MDRRMLARGVAASLLLACLAGSAFAQAIPVARRDGGLLVSDLVADKIYLCRDLNGDGDATDAGEINIWCDSTNADGFANITGAVLSILPSYDGSVYFGDLDTGGIYRGRDLNNDGDVNDSGELVIFYSGFGQTGVASPNGLALDAYGRLYIAKARLVSSDISAVLIAEDRNNNGHALDPGEGRVWMNLNALTTGNQPVPFDITFDFVTCYVVDNGPNPDVVYRAEDSNLDGMITSDERSVFINDNDFSVRTNQAFVNDGPNFFTIGRTGGAANPQVLFRLRDDDASRTINAMSETTELWAKANVPAPFAMNTAASIALSSTGIAVLSFGSATQDNIFLLRDQDSDGLYTSAGETTIFVDSLRFETLLSTGRAMGWLGTPCPADYNLDGFLDQEDLGGFITGFLSEPSDPLCNFNRDRGAEGEINVDQEDLGGYITAFFEGC